MTTAGDIIVFDSIMRSNLPPGKKSTIMEYLDKLSGGYITETNKGEGQTLGQIAGQATVATLVGGTLGAVKSQLKSGLEPAGIALDGSTGLLGFVSAVLTKNHGISKTFSTVAIAASAIYSCRKTEELLGEKKEFSKVSGELSNGETSLGTDPILDAARAL